MHELAGKIEQAAEVIRHRLTAAPRWGLILGSGLGAVAERIECDASFDYSELPHFLRATAAGHQGRLLIGRLEGVPMLLMQGRFHCYEGHAVQLATFPVRVMRALGVDKLIVSNAAGGLNPSFRAGQVMLIEDHLNLLGRNPLIGTGDDRLGPRFPDISSPYDRKLLERAFSIARCENIACHRGVYAAMLGPTYETRAEVRMLRMVGADVVGMSTVPEVVVAVHAGMRVLGLSTVTNVCSSDVPTATTHEEVVATAKLAEEHLSRILAGIVSA